MAMREQTATFVGVPAESSPRCSWPWHSQAVTGAKSHHGAPWGMMDYKSGREISHTFPARFEVSPPCMTPHPSSSQLLLISQP